LEDRGEPGAGAMTGTALTLFTGGDPLDRATYWAGLAPDVRRRRAVKAAHEQDAATLWELALVALTLRGKAGATVSPYTVRNYKQGIDTLLGAWGEENLLRPGRDAATVWVRGMEARGVAPSTIRIRLAAARTLYRGLRWAGAVESDPFADARAVSDKTAPWDKRKPYTEEELATLLAYTRDYKRAVDRALLLLGAHAGLRLAEMTDLRWHDIDLASRELTVRSGKGGKLRRVVMGTTLTAALEALGTARDPEVYVLPFRAPIRAQERMRRLCARAGVAYRGVHALRHSCGTRLVRESKGNLELAASHLGHSNIQTTRAYSHWADEALTQSVGRW